MPERLFPARPLLLVDDEAAAIRGMRMALASSGIDHIVQCEDSREVMGLLAGGDVLLILLDLWMPHLPGQKLLEDICREHPDIPVIVVTGLGDLSVAVECMRAGACDYLVKPLEPERLIASVRRAMDLQELRSEVRTLQDSVVEGRLRHPEAFAGIITASERMRSLFRYAEAVAGTAHPVFVCGETGTGKELFVRAIHELSGRKGDFVSLNVAGVDDNVFADTLFGHIRGAFTGASHERAGLVERAAGGTLFLDEIGDLSEPSQVKLLRLLQEREYLPLGSDVARRSDARIIVATHRHLKELADAGRFRKDLYYRLAAHPVHLPPLSERRSDIPLLCEHFLTKACVELERARPRLPPGFLAQLQARNFPGNVRELETLIFDLVSRGGEGEGDPSRAVAPAGGFAGPHVRLAFPEVLPTLKESSRWLIEEALKRAGGNQSMAARWLGISQQSLNQRLLRWKRSGEAENTK